jgi:hypothetical protein
MAGARQEPHSIRAPKCQAAKNPRVPGTRGIASHAFATRSPLSCDGAARRASGLRRSEPLALKWSDVDFDELQINVRRSIYLNVVGKCKTAASRKPVPWTQCLPPSSGPGNKTAPTDRLMSGCSQALVLAAETLIGRIGCSHMSFARQPCEPGSEST